MYISIIMATPGMSCWITDPILIAIMNHLTGYEEEEVKDAASAEILSDIRLLTITVKGDSEKMVREIQAL